MIPASANAVYNAIQVRMDQVPNTPDMVLRGLELKRQGKAARIGPDKLPLFKFKEPLVVESAFGQPADAVAVRPFADKNGAGNPLRRARAWAEPPSRSSSRRPVSSAEARAARPQADMVSSPTSWGSGRPSGRRPRSGGSIGACPGTVPSTTGASALHNNTTGYFNTATGLNTLYSNTTGSYNIATGLGALQNNTTGYANIALGLQAGYNVTTGHDNIDIANLGVGGESSAIRIGTVGTHISKTYVAGISGTLEKVS